MALKQITGKDFKEALDALTPYGEGDVVWLKELGKTDGGTGLYLIVGWTRDLGYELSDVEANGFTGDNDDYIGYKIGYFNYKPGIRYMLQDFDDFHMPYNLKDDKANGIYKGDVWDTDGYLSNEPSSWDSLASQLNKDAQGIWDTWGENGELDLMESKKKEAKRHTCSMQKKKESLAKKNEDLADDVAASKEKSMLHSECGEYRQAFANLNDKYNKELSEAGITGIVPVFRPEDPYPTVDGHAVNVEFQPFNAEGDWVQNNDFIQKTNGVIYAETFEGETEVSDYCPLDAGSSKDYTSEVVNGSPDVRGYDLVFLWVLKQFKAANPKKSILHDKQYAESKKSEGVYGTIRVDSEDIAIKVQESNVYPSSSGRSLSVEVPNVEAWFSTLSEFSDCIDGMAEDCNGYPDISRDGSDILVQINAPKEDESDDYEVIVELRCSTEITSTSLEGVVDLLNHD